MLAVKQQVMVEFQDSINKHKSSNKFFLDYSSHTSFLRSTISEASTQIV
jgi:hypothetical protein